LFDVALLVDECQEEKNRRTDDTKGSDDPSRAYGARHPKDQDDRCLDDVGDKRPPVYLDDALGCKETITDEIDPDETKDRERGYVQFPKRRPGPEKHAVKIRKGQEKRGDDNRRKNALIKKHALDEPVHVLVAGLDQGRKIRIHRRRRPEIKDIGKDIRDAEKNAQDPVLRGIHHPNEKIYEKGGEKNTQVIANRVDDDVAACGALQKREQALDHSSIVPRTGIAKRRG